MTYNSKDFFKTLANLEKEILPYFPCKAYVFDNNSNEDYQKQLKEKINEQIEVTFGKENAGFGFGHNENAKISKEEYFLICNPDVLIKKDHFAKLFSYLKENDNTVVAPKVLNSDGTTQYLFRRRLTVFDYFLRYLPNSLVEKHFDKRLASYECRDLTDDIQEVKFASGCFLFLRREDFLQVEGFDTRFFMYFEDNDFCQKLREKNKKIMYYPTAEIIDRKSVV